MTEQPAQLPQSIFSTDSVPPEHRFEAWRAALASSHTIEAKPRGFFGRVRSIQVETLLLHVLDSAPVALERSQAKTRQDGLDHVVLHLSRHPIQARADGSDLTIAAGQISVNDLARPTTRHFAPETSSLVAVFPRALVRDALGSCDGLHGRVLNGGAAALLHTHLQMLAEHADAIQGNAGAGLARATASLLAAALAPSQRTFARAAPAFETAKYVRARDFIDAHLTSDRLTPDLIGRAVGLSRSVLFRLFEQHGGVSNYIWSRRLASVRDALGQRHEDRSIAEIGYAFGFTSQAHLSRTFREQYGTSPRDFRAAIRG